MRTLRDRLLSKVKGYEGANLSNEIDNAIEDTIFNYFENVSYDEETGAVSSINKTDEKKLEKLSLLALLEIGYAYYSDKAVMTNDDINTLDMKKIADNILKAIDRLKEEIRKDGRKSAFRIIPWF